MAEVSDAIARFKEAVLLRDRIAIPLAQHLAQMPLRYNDYQKLSRLINENSEAIGSALGILPFRIAVLGEFTTQPIVQAIPLHLLAEGLVAEIYESPYNTIQSQILDRTSDFYQFKPDAVLLAVTTRELSQLPLPGLSEREVLALATQKVESLSVLWSEVKRCFPAAVVIQQNFEPADEYPLGRLEPKYYWSRHRYVYVLNEMLWQRDGEILILDAYNLALRCGARNWLEPRWYYHGKFGFDPNLTFEYGRLLQSLVRVATGRSKKCLVVDLDNTLWGGEIGDDGLGGIVLGRHSSVGEAHLALCNYLKAMRLRGILLAVDSKNEASVAQTVFEKHPEMPLKLDDFSAFYANWHSKSENLKHIAKDLNIGMDAMVFLDDNPVECEEVRRLAPEVTVVELSGDPAYFVRRLDELRMFDQTDITAEDFARAGTLKIQSKLSEIQTAAPQDLHDFLRSLNMTGRVDPSKLDDLPRLEQIFRKTNQFNMTSRRYTRDELQGFVEREDMWCLSGWLEDGFVDYGLVSAVTGRVENSELFIENWVMSCRVFSRTFEEFVFNRILRLAQDSGCRLIRAEFSFTEKNKYAKSVYQRLGFSRLDESGVQWVLGMESSSSRPTFVLTEPTSEIG